jgi:Tfp pilus assembly protein PilF
VQADLQLADLDIREGKLGDARTRLAAVLNRHPRMTRARILMAIAEQLAGRPQDAIEHYRAVIASEAGNTIALNNLAALLSDHSPNYDESIQLAGKALEIDPEFAAAQDTLGWAYYRKGRYDTAVQYLEQAVRKQATARRKYHLALAYLRTGETQRGLAVYKEAVSMDAKLAQDKELGYALAAVR